MEAITKLSEYLKIFNSDTGEFLKLVGDKSKSSPTLSGEVSINDLDNGAIANVSEFEIRLSRGLIDQLDLSKAQQSYLDDITSEYYDKYRTIGEIDSDYYNRIMTEISAIMCTLPALYNAVKDLGTDVTFTIGQYYGAFTDITYTDNTVKLEITGTDTVTQCVHGGLSKYRYYVIINITTISAANLALMQSTIERMKAYGIKFVYRVINPTTPILRGFYETFFYNMQTSNWTFGNLRTRSFYGG